VIVILVVMLLHFKRESHAPFYATALLLILHQWSGHAPRAQIMMRSGAVLAPTVLLAVILVRRDRARVAVT
jgi:hypothetical protein